MRTTVKNIIAKYNNDKARLMDILLDIQSEFGFIPEEAVGVVAEITALSKVDVEQTLSFYHFFSKKPVGEYAVYLNNSVVANMKGRAEVVKAFEEEAGCAFGQVSADGKIGLFNTACIGMSDQEPAAIINGTVFTNLTPLMVKEIVRKMKEGVKASEMIALKGDGKNSSELINSMVLNNIRKTGPVIFSEYEKGVSLKKITGLTPAEVIEVIKDSDLRGRGGSWFPNRFKVGFLHKISRSPIYSLQC